MEKGPKDINREWNQLDRKTKIKRYIKFLLIPSCRLSEFNVMEYNIYQKKSKRKFFRKLLNPLTFLALILIIGIIAMAVFPPWLTVYTIEDLSSKFYLGAFSAPSPGHPMGQTILGWDIYARIVWGARTSLTIGLQSLIISSVFGVMIGTFSAYTGGRIDNIIMRIMDLIMVLPSLILALVFVAVMGPGIENLMLAFGILGIPGYARMIRGSVLQVMTNRYIDSAKAVGASKIKIMFTEILPNAFSPVIISLSFGIAGNIMGLAGLTFFGFGDPTLIAWGNDINIGRVVLRTSPHVTFWPGLFLFLTSLGFMLIGDSLRDAFDPKLSLDKGQE